jgi:hypothetical protein
VVAVAGELGLLGEGGDVVEAEVVQRGVVVLAIHGGDGMVGVGGTHHAVVGLRVDAEGVERGDAECGTPREGVGVCHWMLAVL